MVDNADVQRHRQGWEGFAKFTFRATAGIVVLLILMALFLV